MLFTSRNLYPELGKHPAATLLADLTPIATSRDPGYPDNPFRGRVPSISSNRGSISVYGISRNRSTALGSFARE